MYTITCEDKIHKFKRNFNTLSNLAKYIVQIPRSSVCFPNLKKELTKREYNILISKLVSLYN